MTHNMPWPSSEHLGRTSECGRRMEPWRLGALATVAAVTWCGLGRGSRSFASGGKLKKKNASAQLDQRGRRISRPDHTQISPKQEIGKHLVHHGDQVNAVLNLLFVHLILANIDEDKYMRCASSQERKRSERVLGHVDICAVCTVWHAE